jgi:hypothetical protein
MRSSRLRRNGPATIGLGLVLWASLAVPAGAQQQTLILDPTSGPTGQMVTVSGVVTCPDVAVGGEIHLGLRDPSEGFQTGAPLGTFAKGAGGTIQASVTIPSTMSQLRPGEGIFEMPVTPGGYEIEATCSVSLTNNPSGGAAPFTVTATPATTTSTTVATTTTTVATTTTTLAPSASTATISASQVRPDQGVAISAPGFAANSSTNLTFQSDPVSLGSATANAGGVVETTVTIPRGAAPGAHHVVVSGIDPAGRAHESVAGLTVVDLDCRDFSTRAQAKAVLVANPSDPHGLDADHDGVPCEELPAGGAESPALPRTGSNTFNTARWGATFAMIGGWLLLARNTARTARR